MGLLQRLDDQLQNVNSWEVYKLMLIYPPHTPCSVSENYKHFLETCIGKESTRSHFLNGSKLPKN